MPVYIHELDNWPQFFWDEAVIGPLLAGVSRQQGRLVGRMESLGFDLRNEAVLETLTEDVHKSSEI
jgi:Fic family protein